MIRHFEIRNFKAIQHLSLYLDEFHVFVGPNASGKSSFLDALVLLKDFLSVGPLKTVFGDEKANVNYRAKDAIDLSWKRKGWPIEIAVTVELPKEIRKKVNYQFCRYELALDIAGEIDIKSESFWLCKSMTKNGAPEQLAFFPHHEEFTESIVITPQSRAPGGWRKVLNKVSESGNDYFKAETSKWNNQFRIGPKKSVLANLPEDEEKFPAATWFKRYLMEGIQFISLDADKMRNPSPPGLSKTFLPDGSNIPLVINQLEKKGKRKLKNWIKHIRTALPEIDDIYTNEMEVNRNRFMVIKFNNGLEIPSWNASDGTLRLLALTLLAYTQENDGIILIEEPENGIHPQAVETVYQSLSSLYNNQVFCATHSPVILSYAKLNEILCFGKAPNGAIDIVKGMDHPKLKDWKDELDLGHIFASGILS